MSGFFRKRSAFQLVGDIAASAIGGAKRGVVGTLILAAAESSVPTVGSLVMIAEACALGAAVLIIPAMIAHESLMRDPSSNTSFLTKTQNVCFRAAFAFASGCMGAAILGLAIIPVGVASLTASLTFGVISLMTQLILETTRPAGGKPDYLALHISL